MPTRNAAAGGALGRLLDAGAARLGAAGFADPRREAVALWAALAGTSPGDAWLARGGMTAPDLEMRWRTALDRLASGVPLAYAAGTAGFRTLTLDVDSRVLIPRPETEGLVDLVLDWGRAAHGEAPWGTAVDVGTGSGCIALSLAAEGRFGLVVGVDRSGGALAVAARNAGRARPPVPVAFVQGDLLDGFASGRLTAIVANPPYVAETEMAALPDAVRAHEPHLALQSPEDGLWHTRRLMAAAADLLAPGGLVALEVDSQRGDRVRAIAVACGWRNAEVRRDLFGRDRYLLATKE